jgi:hypothetical protein
MSENPYWSDYTCFAEAVHGRKFSRKTIICNFNSLVDKEDYAKKREEGNHRTSCGAFKMWLRRANFKVNLRF